MLWDAFCPSRPLLAETRAEYKEAVTPIREELKALEEEMDAVRTENKALSAVSARSGRSVRRPGS